MKNVKIIKQDKKGNYEILEIEGEITKVGKYDVILHVESVKSEWGLINQYELYEAQTGQLITISYDEIATIHIAFKLLTKFPNRINEIIKTLNEKGIETPINKENETEIKPNKI